jgi:hypothetical protein
MPAVWATVKLVDGEWEHAGRSMVFESFDLLIRDDLEHLENPSHPNATATPTRTVSPFLSPVLGDNDEKDE